MNPIGFCKDCGREWSGLSEAHCPTCCTHFSGDTAFDLHLEAVASRYPCRDPGAVRDRRGRKQLRFDSTKNMWRLRGERPHHWARKGGTASSDSNESQFLNRGEARTFDDDAKSETS